MTQIHNDNSAWQKYTLDKLGSYINGRAFKKHEWKTNGLPIIRIQNLNDTKANFNYTNKVHEPRYKVENGDLLVSWAASLGVYLWDRGDAWVNQHIFKVIPNEKLVTKDFLYYLLKSVLSELYLKTHGTGMVHITKGDFDSHEVFIPNLPEQEGIVKKLNTALPLVKTSHSNIEVAEAKLANFRQAILTAAITGKLTEDWQLKNLGIPKAQIDYVSPNKKRKVQFDMSHFQLFDLPEDWEWKQFWEVAEIKSNLVSPKDYQDYVLVAPDNIERNTGRLLEKKLVKEINPISAKHLFFKGQIVYSKIRPYLSKLIFADFDGLCSADMYPINPKINVRYLMLFMLSKYFLDTVSNIGTRTLLPKTNQEELNSIPVPVPSLEEQEEIVAKVDAYFEIADKVEKQIGNAEKRVGKLTQAILAKTFRGEEYA